MSTSHERKAKRVRFMREWQHSVHRQALRQGEGHLTNTALASIDIHDVWRWLVGRMAAVINSGSTLGLNEYRNHELMQEEIDKMGKYTRIYKAMIAASEISWDKPKQKAVANLDIKDAIEDVFGTGTAESNMLIRGIDKAAAEALKAEVKYRAQGEAQLGMLEELAFFDKVNVKSSEVEAEG